MHPFGQRKGTKAFCKYMVELDGDVRSTILWFFSLESCDDPFSSRKWRKNQKIRVAVFCRGDISENLVSASLFLRVGSDSCVFTTRIALLERPVSLFSTFSKISLSSFGWDSFGGRNDQKWLILCEKRYATSFTLCSHPICGERVASITFPRKCGTNRDLCIVIRLRLVRSC